MIAAGLRDDAAAAGDGAVHLVVLVTTPVRHRRLFMRRRPKFPENHRRLDCMAEIRVHHLHKAFADFTAVHDSSFAVRRRRVLLPARPLGLRQDHHPAHDRRARAADLGQIFARRRGRDASSGASARDIAFVFQTVRALPAHERAPEHRLPAGRPQGMARDEIGASVEQAARTLRIDAPARQAGVAAAPSGDRQRVALGRAIVRQPLAFLMDEPLGTLDAEFREADVPRTARACTTGCRPPPCYVTHDQMEAMAMADQSSPIMNQGVIEQLGAPLEVYERPASVFVADFIGAPSMNFLPFEAGLASGDDAILIGPARIAVPPLREDLSPRALLCGVRPEHVRFDDASGLRAEVLGPNTSVPAPS